MGWFGVKKSNEVDIYTSLPNSDLLYVSYDKKIPDVIRGIHISISIDEYGHIQVDDSSRQIPDPSTIYIHLPIDEGYAGALPYFPHYIEMTPQQRYKYLCWLRDVTAPIDMGFVFIYYYGLERQLLIGNFDKAFDEIIKLRNAHDNKSFQKYSENALMHSAIMKGRPDRLLDLHKKTEISGYSNVMFLLSYNSGLTLGSSQLRLIFKKLFPLSRTPERENKELFKECIDEILSKKYPFGFPLKDYDISKIKNTHEVRFANYSFPPEIQQVEITNFYGYKPFVADMESLFNDSYTLYKDKKKLLKTGKTPEEIAAALLAKNLRRYKKLLKEKLITQEEHDVLVGYINQNKM